MKKKDTWISIAIIASCGLVLYYYSLKMGYIQIDAGSAAATLNLRSSLLTGGTIHSNEGPVQVRGKVQKPKKLTISAKLDGKTWQIESVGPWGKLRRIKTSNNETTTLRLGPPFIIKPKVTKTGRQALIEFDIIGQAGEYYCKYATRNKGRVASAKLRILDEDEKVIHTGQFRYG